MATNDLFLAKMFLTAEGQSLQNSFTYRAMNAICNAKALADALDLHLTPKVRAVLSTSCGILSWYVENRNNPTDFHTVTYSPTQNGTMGGESMPRFNAMTLYSPTKNKTIRGGSKRFGMISETLVSSSEIAYSGPNQVAIDALITELNSDQSGAGGAIFRHVIVKRVFTPGGLGTPGSYALPTTATDTNSYQANNWIVRLPVTTQNTRKR